GPKNTFGVGARVMVYAGGSEQLQEQFVSRGFLSAVPPELHFGLGDATKIDSVKVIWPNGMNQVLPSPAINTRIYLSESEAKDSVRVLKRKDAREVRLTATQSVIPFRHKEPATLEFDRDPMVPFANTNEGPEISVADINKDGLEDLLISGAKAQASGLFIQQEDGSLISSQQDLFKIDEMNEDVSHVVFDANGDSWPDLLVVSGGNEFREGK
ncbi:MAG: hypothetical protein HKO11_04995, partial [Eudoraea sp.]|nr:hypothetical protein [Eudoraea sp.]